MIGVGVLAASPMMRARLEALIGSRPGLRLVAPPSGLAGPAGRARPLSVGPEVLLVEPGERPAEAVGLFLQGTSSRGEGIVRELP